MMAYRKQGERPAYDVVRSEPFDYAGAARRRRRRDLLGLAACASVLLGTLLLDAFTDGGAQLSRRWIPEIGVGGAISVVMVVLGFLHQRWQARSKSFFIDKLAAETTSFLAAQDARSPKLRVDVAPSALSLPAVAPSPHVDQSPDQEDTK